MRRVLEETFTAVETLLGNKKYQKAMDELEKLDQNQLDSECLGYFYILLTQARVNLGVYNTALIDKAIEIFRFSSDTEKFARAKSLKGYLLSLEGNFSEASEILNEAYVNFKRCGNLHKAASALNRMTYCSFKLSNISTAIQQIQNVVNIFQELNDKTSVIKTLINLESLLHSSGKLNECLSLHNKIEEDISVLNKQDFCKHVISSSKLFGLLGNYSNVLENITRAKPYIDDYPREKAIYFENLGLINILSGEYAEAEKALKEGLKISLEIAPESALISQIKRLFGDLYIATGKYDQAEKYTKEALIVAEKIGEKVEIAACYRIFAQLKHHKSSQADKAREYYHKAIDLFKLIGSRYELAVTQYIAATSGLYHSGERHAMLYMARDYFESEQVEPYIKKIEKALENKSPKEQLKPISSNGPVIITVNPKMKKIVELAENIAQSDISVLLTGETGTGKDLMASYIHHMSGREGNFVEVNCPLFVDGLFEAELFGSVKGAYTSAYKDRIGRVEKANNGTLFLNEVGDIPIQHQVKLLRVLESGEYEKVGSSKRQKANCRVIAATNHDLEQRMHDGLFRADLYYRLKCVHIDLPSLNDRREDINQLVLHFLEKNGISINNQNGNLEKLTSLLLCRIWTGNVRQLKYYIKKLSYDSGNDINMMIDLVRNCAQKADKKELIYVLKMTNWNRSRAAEIMGVSEGTIRNWIAKHDLVETNS